MISWLETMAAANDLEPATLELAEVPSDAPGATTHGEFVDLLREVMGLQPLPAEPLAGYAARKRCTTCPRRHRASSDRCARCLGWRTTAKRAAAAGAP